MAIILQENYITLHTAATTYQMGINENRYLTHLYYGPLLDDSYACEMGKLGYIAMSAFPYDGCDRESSPTVCPLEYPVYGSGDFRTTAIKVQFPDGSWVCDLRFESAKILESRPRLEGLPALYDEDNRSQSVEICLKDTVYDFRVYLLYTIFEKQDIVARSVRVENHTGGTIRLDYVLSSCIDNYKDDFDFVSFYGKANGERSLERVAVNQAKLVCESRRGSSSHQKNPFVIFCSKDCGEDRGECYGSAFVYSGNFTASIEKTQMGTTRFVMGIHPEGFHYVLENGESFQAPEVIHSYSSEGFSKLTHNYHNVIRRNLCRGKYKESIRPLLINSWEATYFDFNAEKLVSIAKRAKAIGVDTFVLDDGWFSGRKSDNSSLGDWFVDEEKLGVPLKKLIAQINGLDMKFGLWFEPECISENSELYRKHPTWCLQAPGRPGALSRNQWVLNMANPDVVDAIFNMMADILDENNIEYLKWDFNRSLTDIYYDGFPNERQGEVSHRYVLGVYSLLDRICSRYPNLLIEGCSCGGGRFDCGMLYYAPQIWASDNSDPICRLDIQYGTSFCYPVISMGAHVTASPNHNTLRETPLKTRSSVAMAGTYGFELDLTTLSDEEIRFLKEETAFYKRYADLVIKGDYYRLTDIQNDYIAWQFVSENADKSLAVFVQKTLRLGCKAIIQCVKGLDSAADYEVIIDGEKQAGVFSGCALMQIGVKIKTLKAEYDSTRVEMIRVDEK